MAFFPRRGRVSPDPQDWVQAGCCKFSSLDWKCYKLVFFPHMLAKGRCFIQHFLLTLCERVEQICENVETFAHIPMGMLRVENGYGGQYKGNISTVNNSCMYRPLTMLPYRPKGHFRVGWRWEVSSPLPLLSTADPWIFWVSTHLQLWGWEKISCSGENCTLMFVKLIRTWHFPCRCLLSRSKSAYCWFLM